MSIQKKLLKEKLKQFNFNQNDLAVLLNVTYQTISIKMNRHKDFTQDEMFRMINMLQLTAEETMEIFFNMKDYVRGENAELDEDIDKIKL